MKKTLIALGVAAATALATFAATQADPVVMTVNGLPVLKSEFEYLYNKNASQQLQPQTLMEYVEMFKDYKLKVADALAARLDTTRDFRDEYNKFRFELAAPYLEETEMIDSMIAAAYSHYPEQVNVSHIMLPLGQDSKDMAENYARLDSIRNLILSGDLKWDEAVYFNTIDGGTKARKGNMGWLPLGRFPWQFEDMAYATKVGEISPIVNSGFGYHIIRVEQRRPNPGEVQVKHILRTTRGLDSTQVAATRALTDSLYNVLTTQKDADFDALARQFSQDPGSASRGGDLGWFGPGAMVVPFDSAAFALKVGEVSQPVETAFGYHILFKTAQRPYLTFDQAKKTIESQISNDDRQLLAIQRHQSKLESKFKAALDKKGLDKIYKMIAKNPGGYDSTMVEKLRTCDITVFTIGKKKYPVKAVMKSVPVTASTDASHAITLIKEGANQQMKIALGEMDRDDLLTTNADYRNLVNEYRDGILLFARATDQVWDRASRDTQGLEEFFNANRSRYHWDAPKYVGYVVMAMNDSLLNEARQYTDSLTASGSIPDHDTLVQEMRNRFNRSVKIERVVAAKGDNPITDYLAFAGEKPDKPTWNSYYAWNGGLQAQPQKALDVRSQVVTDYQNYLEQQWLKEIRAKYPIVVFREVLDTITELPVTPTK